MAEKLKRLKESLEKSPVVKKGDYDYFVHPLTDGVPVIEPELLEEVAQANIDKIVIIEAMGIPIGAKALQEIGAEISDKKTDIKSLCKVDIVDGKVVVKE